MVRVEQAARHEGHPKMVDLVDAAVEVVGQHEEQLEAEAGAEYRVV